MVNESQLRIHPFADERTIRELRSADTAPGEVTRRLQDWNQGRPEAEERLLALIYGSLHLLARRSLGRERRDHTLQTTELVHEAYLRLSAQSRYPWQSRGHFFAIAIRAIRRVLLDHARRDLAGKRIGHNARVGIDDAPEPAVAPNIDLTDLQQALARLARLDSRQARLVELRFFDGLTIHETAARLNISPATVKREWRLAQAWLRREMSCR